MRFIRNDLLDLIGNNISFVQNNIIRRIQNE